MFKRKLVILLILFSGINTYSFATHLMGGSMSYTYLGQVGSQYRYEVKIEMYRDCYHVVWPQTSPTPFDPTIAVGIYNNNSTLSLYTSETFDLTSEISVTVPNGGSACSKKFAPNVCISQGIYDKIILLPYSNFGYHLLFERCCRNNLVNINNDEGQSYYVFIPPSYIHNSSPSFSGIPTPYICANDSIQLSYAANDPDGDSLVYNLVIPWQGANSGLPNPTPGSNLTLPLDNVTYLGSYSFTNPFGTGGMALIDHSTGIVTVQCPSTGFWAIAVECREYRNGQLLSIVRRDIELIVVQCLPNNTPVLTIPGNKTDYAVEAGDILRFKVSYSDPDGDTIFLTRSGDIFGGGTMQPPYATLPEDTGKSTVSSTFTWQTSCSQANKNPYFFTVKARDSGCPPKTRINIFKVTVNPFKGPDSISGPKKVCEQDKKVRYRVYGLAPGNPFFWIIQGGTITSRTDTSFIDVTWGKGGSGKISLAESSRFGCGNSVVSINVVIIALPVTDAGSDKTICSGFGIQLGNTSADNSNTYRWSPAIYLSDSTVAAPKFYLINIGTIPVFRKYILKASNSNGCINYDTVLVAVNPQYDTFSITGNKTPCFNGTFTYNAPPHAGSSYQWIITGGKQVSGKNGYTINIYWTDSSKGRIQIVETNKYGCQGDTSNLFVRIITPVIKIIGPKVVCPNSVKIDYWVNYTAGSSYSWHVDNGILVGSNSGPAIQVNWGDSGTAMIWTYETTKEGCISDTAFFPVIISYHLQTSEIYGDTFVCEHSKAIPYYVINSNGSTYYWSLKGADAFANNFKHNIFVDWGQTGMGRLAVQEKSYDSVNKKVCIGDTVFQDVIINPVPTTSPIRGPVELCEKNSGTYFVTGFNKSVFTWIIDPPVKFNGQGKNTITVFWDSAQSYHLSVVELSKDSCTGPLIDTVIVIHPNPTGRKIFGDSVVCYPDNNNIAYFVTGFQNSTFNWQVIGGDIISGSNTSHITVNWYQVPSGYMTVNEITQYGCEGPLLTLKVIVDSIGTEIEKVSTLTDDDKKIEISWVIFNDKYFNNRSKLFRSDASDPVWKAVDSCTKDILYFIDKGVVTGNFSYNYKTSAKDLCGIEHESPVHRSILLTGDKNGNFDIVLHWNSYIGWKDGVDHYDIYRKINFGNDYTLYKNAGNDTTKALSVGTEGFIQYYRIVAVKNGDENVQSWSNEITFKYPPIIFIPNSFSPNGDGINDIFTVTTANVNEFEMLVFNRWGEIIFTSQDQNIGWDGTYKGQLCEPGTYGLGVTYKGNSPEKTYIGTITLLR